MVTVTAYNNRAVEVKRLKEAVCIKITHQDAPSINAELTADEAEVLANALLIEAKAARKAGR